MTPKTIHNKSGEQSVDKVQEQQVFNEEKQKMDDKLKKLENEQKLEDKIINKPNDIVYDLEWSIRDDLILNLNHYSSMLLGKQLKTEQKGKLMKNNVNLYETLIKLPVKSNSENSNILNKISTNELNQLILELDYKTRSRITEILIENHSLSTLIDGVSNDIKLNLIKKNNELICELFKLPVRIVDGNTESSSNETDLLNEEDVLLKEINGLKINSAKRFDLKDLSISEVSLNFMAKEVDKFLKSKYSNAKESLHFYCHGIKWLIGLVKVKDLKGDFFSIYLKHDFKNNNNSNSFFIANYDLLFLNQKDSYKHKKISNRIDSISTEDTYIYNDIKESFDQLKIEGFIYEDSIKISVELKIEKLEKM